MSLADLHIHSIYSPDGTATIPEILNYVVEHTRLSLIAITDHNEIAGALEAQNLASNYGIEVVMGEEITTKDGHLLALFINKQIPAGLSAIETILMVGEQDGLCIAAHPMARGAPSLSAETIRNIANHAQASKIMAGIEVYNAGLFHRGSNDKAQKLAESLCIPAVGNSDSHILETIGQGATEFEGLTAVDFKNALYKGLTKVVRTGTSSPFEIICKWLPRQFRHSLKGQDYKVIPGTFIYTDPLSQEGAFYPIAADVENNMVPYA